MTLLQKIDFFSIVSSPVQLSCVAIDKNCRLPPKITLGADDFVMEI